MKNKIAIMTQPLGHNYGGIIQNYALQKILVDMGNEVVTISRVADNPHSNIKIVASKYKSLFFRLILKSQNPKHLEYRKIYAHNLKFINRHIKISPVLDSTNKLAEYFKKENFTSVIVGSDQVWRPKYSPNILNFYLDFLRENNSIKKFAYAASFGTDKWEYTEIETKKCIDLIQQFDMISVREDSGINLCKNYLKNSNAAAVLDPTLLLDAEDYSLLIGQKSVKNGLFTYVLDDSIEKKAFLEKCAKVLNLEVFSNQAKFPISSFDSNIADDYFTPPIEGWLKGYRDAEFVITDSFHGTVFSIINSKPFFALVNKDRGASRFESILRKLGLEDRLIYNLHDFDFAKLKSSIDYKGVNIKLNILKAESLSILNRAFEK